MSLLQNIMDREMPPRKVRYEVKPDPIGSPPYMYYCSFDGEEQFLIDGIAQAAQFDLYLLYIVQSEEDEDFGTKEWYTTQLRLYGIPFNESATLLDASIELIMPT